jgi:hypothetical protein
LCIGFGMFCLAANHQSKSEASMEGGLHSMRSQDRTLCHTCREKGHVLVRWFIDSGSWSHSRHIWWCCYLYLASLSTVQDRSKLASQWKNLKRGGA